MHFGEKLDEERFLGLIDRAYEKGARTFMTADVYGQGAADEMLARGLAGKPRDSYCLVGVQSMKPVLLALLAFCLLMGGCKTVTKYNPFTTDSYCATVLGYPSNAIARILDIEKPIGPKDMPFDDYD